MEIIEDELMRNYMKDFLKLKMGNRTENYMFQTIMQTIINEDRTRILINFFYFKNIVTGSNCHIVVEGIDSMITFKIHDEVNTMYNYVSPITLQNKKLFYADILHYAFIKKYYNKYHPDNINKKLTEEIEKKKLEYNKWKQGCEEEYNKFKQLAEVKIKNQLNAQQKELDKISKKVEEYSYIHDNLKESLDEIPKNILTFFEKKYKKQNDIQVSLDKYLCKVCMEKEIDCILRDCGHCSMCSKCCKQVDKCPICRKEFNYNKFEVSKIFI